MPTSLIDWTRPNGIGVITVVPPTSVATGVPSGSDGVYTDRFDRIRTLFKYVGNVTTCVVKLWVRDPSTTEWYEGSTTDDISPLTPGGASPVNEAREWVVGQHQDVHFQVVSILGGGTVEVKVQGVQE